MSTSVETHLVLDALAQAIWALGQTEGLVHHSDRGSQYLATRYSEPI